MNNELSFDKMWNNSPMGRIGCGCPVVIAILLSMFLFCSCATKTKIEYVDREVEKLVVREVHDTLREQVHDSTIIREKGDTLLIEKWHTKYRDRIVVKTDTCWRDSIQVEYKEKIEEVVKYPKSYWYLLGISILFIIFAFIKLARWLK